jgi:hypothetical protein
MINIQKTTGCQICVSEKTGEANACQTKEDSHHDFFFHFLLSYFFSL